MEGRAFPLKKLITLCAACLLALSGCNGGDAALPSPEGAEPPATTPLSLETPAVQTPAQTSAPVTQTLAPSTDVLPSASLPVESPPLPTGTSLLWDGNPDSLTLGDFPTQLSNGTDVSDSVAALQGGDKAGLYLVFQLPEQDTWLYGFYTPDGVQGLILRVGTQWQALDIPFLAPQALLPAMSYGDYDGDGDAELAIVYFVGGGSGTNVWGLSVVDFSSGGWELFQFADTDYTAIVDLSLSCLYDSETNRITLFAGDASLELDPASLGYSGPAGELEAGLGNWVHFTTAGDDISAAFGITLWAPDMPPEGVRVATLHANVVYTGSAFGLNSPALTLPEF